MATHSGILACKIPWTEEPSRTVHGVSKESDMTEHAYTPGLASLSSPLLNNLLLFPKICGSPLSPTALMLTPLLVFILTAAVFGSSCVDSII